MSGANKDAYLGQSLLFPAPYRIYPSDVHAAWARPDTSWSSWVAMCSMTLAAAFVSCFVCPESPPSKLFLALFCSTGVIVRFVVYPMNRWSWYTVDYCMVVSILLARALVSSPGSTEDSARLFLAINSVGVFAVILKTKPLLHHWDTFWSFWIHTASLWVTWAFRYWGEAWSPNPALTTGFLIRDFFTNFWGPWAGFYVVLILTKPIFPWGLAEHADCAQDFGVTSAVGKLVYVLSHGALSLLGALLACGCYHSKVFHLVFLVAVSLCSVVNFVPWYKQCAAKANGQQAATPSFSLEQYPCNVPLKVKKSASWAA